MTSGVIGGPLAGVRVVEFDAIGPVPLAAMILADFGCDIVRIGRAGRPPSPSADGPILGRGRRSISLDLKTQPDRDTALAIVARADVVLEGNRPGVMERLGLGPDACLAANPKLVYGRMTGWGQTGPLAQTAGHDINYIALTGVLHAIGGADRPVPPLNLVGDYGGGTMLLALGVVAALVSARTTGRGQVVDAAMTDGSALLMTMFYTMHAAGLWRDAREANLLDGGAPFYRTYACADGGHVAVGAIEPAFFAALLAGLGLDAAGIDQGDRSAWPDLASRFAARFAERSRDDWADVFAGTDACVTPVLSLAEAPDHAHNRARATFAAPSGPMQPMPAPRFSVTPATVTASEATDADAILKAWAS
ncbi:CaiB/BaiF CoA-transferase family protein [Sphingomonas sp. 4RDLI-65]|uniref:CaiB/BaiF CoA transferase family protein n=1 Tax=Sphingomonas sp. 4RDLI-65 TaxID=3111641 RepID=UPI003C210719